MLAVTAVAFGLAWWLGLYLIARDPVKPELRRAGYGLIGYALAIACTALTTAAPAYAAALTALQSGLVCLPAVAWSGVLLRLAPVEAREIPEPWWRWVLVPLAGLALAGLVAAGGFGAGGTAGTLASWLVAAVVLAPLIAAFGLLLTTWRRARPSPVRGLLLVATLLVGLAVSALLLALAWLPVWLLIAGVGADLVVLGVAVAVLDASSEGETLRPDMRRSALTALLASMLFGGQITAAMLLGAGRSPIMVALLLGSIAAAVTLPVLAGPLHRLLDRVSFPQTARLRAERAELREVADRLPRRATAGHPLADLDAAEFAQLTRRALTHYGNLGRLVSSPLTGLPLLDRRLADGGSPGHPLERATELKAVLLESISRLKPPDGDFGTSDEWRHYNSLYFPYVLGLRPYSRRARHTGLPATARQALRWLQAEVPERTLHNWQNAAAKLVAEDLRSRGFAAMVDQV